MIPPDHTQGLARLRLLYAQRLDFDRATVGWLLDEVERLKAAVAEEREACAQVAESYLGLRSQSAHIAELIRARGEAK